MCRAKKWKCKVKIVLDGGNFLNQFGEHTHPPNPEKIDVKKIRPNMKRDARETNAKTNNIITVDMDGASDGVLAKIGKVATIRRDVRRQRVLNMEYPPIPDNTILEIADPFNVSSTGEPFLHYDNGRDNRIIIFGTTGSLDFLQNSEHWFMDGTFSTVPPQFLQLYTVNGFQQGRNGVGAYSLLTNIFRASYADTNTNKPRKPS